MTDPQETDFLSDALDSAADKVFSASGVPSNSHVDGSVAKPDTSPGQSDPEPLQEVLEDDPESVPPADLALAWQEIGRAEGKYGPKPAGIAGKTDAEIVALATELETLRRQEKREYVEQAQGESASHSSDDESQGAGPDAKAAPVIPDHLETLAASLKEEGREEEADRLLSAFTAQQSQINAITARLDGEAQARQLEPIEKAAEAVFAGLGNNLPDLSKSQRDDLMATAALIGKANPDKFEAMDMLERVSATLSAAIEASYGVTAGVPKSEAQPRKRVVADPISRGSHAKSGEQVPTTMDECLDQAASRAFEGWSR